MVEGVQWALVAEAVLSLALGVVVLWRGLDRAVAVVLSVGFGAWTAILLLNAMFFGADAASAVPGWMTRVFYLVTALLVSFTYLLMAVYPGGLSPKARRWMVRLAVLPIVVASLGAIADYYPRLPVSLASAGYFLVTRLSSPVGQFLPALWFLVHALRSPDGPRRLQFAGAAAAMMIWVMNDVWPDVLDFAQNAERVLAMNVYMQLFRAFNLVGLALSVALVSALIVQAAKRRRSWSVALTVGGWTLVGFAAAQLQLLAAAETTRVVHFVVDMTAFLVLFYFVARYQLIDVALSRPSFTTRGLAVAMGLAALIAAQVMLEQTVGASFGWIGAVLAGIAVASTLPLQQRLERTRTRGRATVDQYEAFRRMQVYQAALEGALKDGQLDAGDNQTLTSLRAALGVGQEDHDRLLADLKGLDV